MKNDLEARRRELVRSLDKLATVLRHLETAVANVQESDDSLWQEVARLRDVDLPETPSGERAREALEELRGYSYVEDFANAHRELVTDLRGLKSSVTGNDWDEAMALVGRAR